MSDLIVENMTKDQVRPAYPLVRQADPSIDLDAWLRFASRLGTTAQTRSEGIVAARRRHGKFPIGLFFYRSDRDLKHGKLLTAQHFVAIDVLDSSIVLAALLAKLDQIALDLRCNVVRSIVRPGSANINHSLMSAGFTPEGNTLSKLLDGVISGADPLE